MKGSQYNKYENRSRLEGPVGDYTQTYMEAKQKKEEGTYSI